MSNKPNITTCALEQDKLDEIGNAWSHMEDCTAHHVKSTLAAMRMTGLSLERVLPSLIKAYRLAVEHQLITADIDERRLPLESLEKGFVPDISKEISRLMEFLALSHQYNQKLFSDSTDIKVLSAKACIDQVLTNYSFATDKEKSLIKVECEHDFNFKSSPIFIELLIKHLVENAFYYINDVEKGDIRIWTEIQEDFNIIHVKDTGTGMSPDALERVFSHYYSKRNNVTIPGLGYCRLAILHLGGDVECHSVKGEYTEFLIKFCKLPNA